MVHVTADTCVRCGEHGESRMVRPLYEPDAPPRVTEAKTGGAALGSIVFSLLFLLAAVERMLEPLLLPLDKDGPVRLKT
jgi:hypothetical protein